MHPRMIMLDLETAGQGPDAAIIAIGACNILPGGLSNVMFYHVVDVQSVFDIGGVIDPGTFLWWMKQSEEARSVFKQPGNHIANVLDQFAVFLDAISEGQPKKVQVWGNGSDFDNVILAQTYKRAGIPLPWSWWDNRCYRTIKAAFRKSVPEPERTGTKHNALEDAIHQAKHLAMILQHMDEINNPPALVDLSTALQEV